MRKLRVLVACIVAFFAVQVSLAAPARGPAASPSLVGHWYGIGEPDDPDIFYIDSYHADGTFHSEYRKCEKGKLVYQQTQSGKWNYRGGVLTMNSDMINGKPGVFDHFYTIESLTQNAFKARLHMPDFLFEQSRIPAFEFPPCYLGA